MRGLSQSNGSIILEFLLVMPIYFVLIGGTFWIGELLLNRDNLLISDRLATGHWGGRHDWDNDKRKKNDDTMRFRLNFWLFDIWGQNSGGSPIVTDVTQSRFLQHPKYSWSQTVGSKTSLWAPQPAWTRGWLHGSDEAWQEILQNAGNPSLRNAMSFIRQIPDDIIGMNARISEYNFLNVSLMRTKKGEKGYRFWEKDHPPGELSAKLCHECFQDSCGKISCYGGTPVANAVWFEKVYNEKYPEHSLEELKYKMGNDNKPEHSDSETANCGSNDQSDYARFPTYVLWGQ